LKAKVEVCNYIFNPTFGLVHIWPKFGLKQPSIFRMEWNYNYRYQEYIWRHCWYQDL